MSAFIMNDITDGGLSALAYALTGEELRFTKIIIGSGYMPDGATPRSMEAVVTPEATLDIIKKTIGADPSTVVIGGAFTNKDTSADFYYRELALYAETDSTGEVLYCYGNAGDCAELIPAGGAGNVIEKVIEVTAAIGGAANVTAHINLEAYATVRQMEEAIEAAEMKTDPEVKIDLEKIKVDVAKIEVDTKEIKTNTEDIKLDIADVKKDVGEVDKGVTAVSVNIGGTADTGGTATKGTLNAKANATLDKVGNLEGSLNKLQVEVKKVAEKRLAASDNAKHSFGPIKIKAGTVTVFTTFVPPYSGNIKVNIQWAERSYADGGGSLMLRIFRGGDAKYFFLPDCSAITPISTGIDRLDDAFSVPVPGDYVDNYFVIPVEKGIPVVFTKGWSKDHNEGVRLFSISYDMIDIEAE